MPYNGGRVHEPGEQVLDQGDVDLVLTALAGDLDEQVGLVPGPAITLGTALAVELGTSRAFPEITVREATLTTAPGVVFVVVGWTGPARLVLQTSPGPMGALDPTMGGALGTGGANVEPGHKDDLGDGEVIENQADVVDRLVALAGSLDPGKVRFSGTAQDEMTRTRRSGEVELVVVGTGSDQLLEEVDQGGRVPDLSGEHESVEANDVSRVQDGRLGIVRRLRRHGGGWGVLPVRTFLTYDSFSWGSPSSRSPQPGTEVQVEISY